VSAVSSALYPSRANVVVDFFWIDVAGILEHHPHLFVEVLVQITLQLRHGFPPRAFLQLPRRGRHSHGGRRISSGSTRTSGPEEQGAHHCPCGGRAHCVSMPRRPSPAPLLNGPHPGSCRPGPCRHLLQNRILSFVPWQTLLATCRALRLSFDCPPFELLEHLSEVISPPPLRHRTTTTGRRGCMRLRIGRS